MDTNTQPELLPCPFCGNEPKYLEMPDHNGDTVICKLGHVRMRTVEGWNTRAGLAARSPRDEDAVEYFERQLTRTALPGLVGEEFMNHLRTLINASKPHPVERGEG